MVCAAQFFDEFALPHQQPRAGSVQPVLGRDVHRDQIAAAGRPGDPCAAPQELFAFRTARQRDDDAFAGLPFRVDVVFVAVFLQRFVDVARQPEQRQLAQCGQVSHTEIVAQCGVHAVRRIDEAGGKTFAQVLRGQIDQFDAVCGTQHLVGNGFTLFAVRDGPHDVVQRFDMLHVDGGDDVDAGVQQVDHVLPAFFVRASGNVRMGQLVDEGDLRAARDDGEQIHFIEPHATGFHAAPRHRLQAFGGVLRGFAAMGLQQGDDDVLALLDQPSAFGQHRICFAHAGRRTEQNPQRTPLRHRHIPSISKFRRMSYVPWPQAGRMRHRRARRCRIRPGCPSSTDYPSFWPDDIRGAPYPMRLRVGFTPCRPTPDSG